MNGTGKCPTLLSNKRRLSENFQPLRLRVLGQCGSGDSGGSEVAGQTGLR